MFPTSEKKLEKYLAHFNLAPQKKWGQNFLIENSFHVQLVKAGELSSDDVVVEIGPGLGHLTQFLTPHPRLVIAAEIDPDFVRILEDRFSAFSNVKIVEMDILARKTQINPELLALLEKEKDYTYKVLANLPYNVSAPLIINFLKLPTPPERIVVTVQKEVADRLKAKEGTSAYGPLSIMAQVWGKVSVIANIPPKAFYPRPKVVSSIVKIVSHNEYRTKILNLDVFHALVQAIFGMRRKTLQKALRTNPYFDLKREDLPYVLGNLDASCRGETLNLTEFISLSNRLSEKDIALK